MANASSTTVVTLAERERRRLATAATAIAALDVALSAYARREGGRFIRYGSSATGRMRVGSDVDVIADFGDDRAAQAACRFADDTCLALGLSPDVRPLDWISPAVLARAQAEGIVLS